MCVVGGECGTANYFLGPPQKIAFFFETGNCVAAMVKVKRTSVSPSAPWKAEEDEQLQTLQASMGCKWQQIAKIMATHDNDNRRSVDSVRNRFIRLQGIKRGQEKHGRRKGRQCRLRCDKPCDATPIDKPRDATPIDTPCDKTPIDEGVVGDKLPLVIPVTAVLVSEPENDECHDTPWFVTDDVPRWLEDMMAFPAMHISREAMPINQAQDEVCRMIAEMDQMSNAVTHYDQ